MKLVVNGEPFEAAGGLTVAELLARMQFKSAQVAVEVNLELVPRAEHAGHQLSEGDRVEVVTLVGGG